MAIIVSPVSIDGNLSFNRDEGLVIPLREIDDSGEQINLSTLTRVFNINHGQFRKQLTADPNNAEGKLLSLTQEELYPFYGRVSRFSYTDEDGLIPIVLWEGQLYERN